MQVNPMAHMRPPKVPFQLMAIPPQEAIATLLKACAGVSFEDRRDAAIIRLMADTGARRQEIANIELDGIDLRERTVAF